MILTVRLEKHDEELLERFARSSRINRTQAVKELLNKGFMIAQLLDYKSGKLSIGRLAEALEISVAEALSLVAMHNAHPHMPGDYVSDALENAASLKPRSRPARAPSHRVR